MPSLEDLTVPELLAQAKKLEEGNRLFNTLLNDPETRAETLKLVKRKNPSMPIPEVEASNELEQKLEVERAERRKLEERITSENIERRIEKERARVMKAYDLTDEDMSEVEKIMTDKEAPIPHYDAAAKVFKAQRSQAAPTSHLIANPTFTMPTKDIWKGGIGNKAALNNIALDQAYKAWNEVAGGKAKAA